MSLRGAHLHFDCTAGIAGDMTLAALCDLGVPVEVVERAIAGLDLGIALSWTNVVRGGMAARKVDVRFLGEQIVHDHVHVHVHDGERERDGAHAHHLYSEIRARIVARADADVARWALAIFDRLAEVEARRHGVAFADVAFHELGAADSIADIVGCAAALAWLAPKSFSCRRVPLGGGVVKTAHGVLPVPAPATLELLTGCAVESGGMHELTTPTGAAIVRALAETVGLARAFDPMPAGRVLASGWGAGTRELADRPNALRVVAVEPAPIVEQSNEVDLLETNLDDLAPNLVAPLIDALLAGGALDAWLTPITMKKGRPGYVVSALVEPSRRAAIEAIFFRESTTLGVRCRRETRAVLDRELVEIPTELGPITVKLAGRRDPKTGTMTGHLAEILSATPELEVCRRVATERGLPLRRVYEIALVAAASRKTS